MSFEACYPLMMRWELGYADHPRDPGGKTQDGVTERVFHAWLRQQGRAVRDVRTITSDEKKAIYRAQYWDAVRGDDLPPGVNLAVFDFAVNSGPSRAIRHLQAALGVKQDGVIGAVTLQAVWEAYERDEDGEVIARIMASRDAFLRGLSTFDAFGRGWTNRTRDIRNRAARMEAIEDNARTFNRKAARPDRSVPRPPPATYRPDAARTPDEPVTPQPPAENPALWSLGGLLSSIIGALSNGYALAGFALVLAFVGVGFWAWKTGRISFNKAGAA